MFRLAFAALILTGVATLAGCGSDGDDSDPTAAIAAELASRAPIADSLAVGDDFEFAVPDGWIDITDIMENTVGVRPEIAVSAPPRGVFSDNVNVITIPHPSGMSPEEKLESARSELEAFGFGDVEDRGEVMVGGSTGRMISYEKDGAGPCHVDQIYVTVDGTDLAITITSAIDATDAHRAELIEKILSEWRWT